MKFIVLFCLIASSVIVLARSKAGDNTLGCRDEEGNLVDWFYLYKLPSDRRSDNNDVDHTDDRTRGLRYLYITPSTVGDGKFRLSERLINETESFTGRTLDVIYRRQQRSADDRNNLVMIYNDEPTQGQADGSRGHTKGVIVADKTSGFWLIHSVPKFPPSLEENRYSYPKSGMIYGQSFLCISMNGNQFESVGRQLQYNEPHFYSGIISDDLKTLYPTLAEAFEMQSIKKGPFNNTETLRSRDGVEFTSFAKSRKYERELYEDFVAPYYSSGDFYVETWRHGAGNLDSNCTRPSRVYNIESISFRSNDVRFDTLKDHSKWMVNNDRNLICVGDINRQEHQMVRGGGTVCTTRLPRVATIYNDGIKSTENCKRRNHIEKKKNRHGYH